MTEEERVEYAANLMLDHARQFEYTESGPDDGDDGDEDGE